MKEFRDVAVRQAGEKNERGKEDAEKDKERETWKDSLY